MSKGLNQKLKLSYLTKIMLAKTDDEHSLTMSQIMAELEKYEVTAERKSIYTDFKDITDKLGIEIMKEQIGRETYYHVASRKFELAEVKLLVDAIQSSKFITERKSRELIKKVKTFVSEYQASALQRQVYVNGRIKTMNESIYYSVDTIHMAIAENKQISFLYCAWNTNKELVPKKEGARYKISPWALTWDNENYYLVGYDSEAKHEKFYRVDKMMKIQLEEDKRDGKKFFKNFDLAEFMKQRFGMYDGDVKKVRIEFPDGMVGIFIDRFGKDITIRPMGDGISEITVDVAISGQFIGWIYGLGPNVKITGPDSVVEEISERTNAFMANYK